MTQSIKEKNINSNMFNLVGSSLRIFAPRFLQLKVGLIAFYPPAILRSFGIPPVKKNVEIPL